ncbi:thiamine pyrophosphate-binding protein [Methanobrevibacter arboriphilus]|uniref:thiamine pyrophosphate-binding protein n=1 Tax=Methanobrevibacter arboriphilus TaxID=39441 RepID=UPI000ACD3CC1|nr:thiamine pyrophosphate-binding protein [Methanobrevibacter arboriphilus]
MNTAECIVKILENSGVKHIFGHPGEQIIPFYGALNNSKIGHVLMRHEQGAVHAADAYSRVSGKFGVCVSTAGPGALNMVMGVGVAFKDSVPMLVITGDNHLNHENKDEFQDIDIEAIFKPITIKTFNPKNGRSSIDNIKKAVKILNNEPRGPIHINLSKNVLLDKSIDHNNCNLDLSSDYYLSSDYPMSSDLSSNYYDYNKIDDALLEIKKSKRPLIVAGAGIFWADSVEELKKIFRN